MSASVAPPTVPPNKKMALRAGKPKDVKKSSYYVWFLGAKESGGVRGEEHVRPAVRHLIDREGEVEPLKVTLQVSSKGLKIIQNLSSTSSSRTSGAASKGKVETTKHFIPDHSITCVSQEDVPDDDVVACILLIYNPVSKCPVHVHAYRCDSVDTATVLRQHLQQLIDRPENQHKFSELEVRLRAKGLIGPTQGGNQKGRCTSDGHSIRTESDTSGGSSEKDIYALDDRMSNLYDSLAAELREKLNNKKNNGPILLPPRDYDAGQSLRGKLPEVVDGSRAQLTSSLGPVKKMPSADLKRSSKLEPLGSGSGRLPSGFVEEQNSSGKSSGIGSDEAPSSPSHEREVGMVDANGGRHLRHREPSARELAPIRPPYEPGPPSRQPKVNNQESSSDEEWEANRDPQAKSERDMMLVQSPIAARRPLVADATRSEQFRHGVGNRSRERRSLPPPTPELPVLIPTPVTHKERYYDRDDNTNRNWSPQLPVVSSELPQQSIIEHHTAGPQDVRSSSQRHHHAKQEHERAIESCNARHPGRNRSPRRQPSSPDDHSHDRPPRRASETRGDFKRDGRQGRSGWEVELDERARPFSGSGEGIDHRSSPSSPTTRTHHHPQLIGSKSFDDKRHGGRRVRQDEEERPLDYRHHREDTSHHHINDTRRSSSPSTHVQSATGSPNGAAIPSRGTDYRGTPAVFRDAFVPLPRIRRIDSGGHSSSNSSSNNNNKGNSNGHPNRAVAAAHRPPPHYTYEEGDQSLNKRAVPQANYGKPYQELPDEKRFPGLDRSTARVQHHLLLNSGVSGSHATGNSNGEVQQRPLAASQPPPPFWNANRGERAHAQDAKQAPRERQSRDWEEEAEEEEPRRYSQQQRRVSSSPSRRSEFVTEERGNRLTHLVGNGSASAHQDRQQQQYLPSRYSSSPSACRSPEQFRSSDAVSNCHAARPRASLAASSSKQEPQLRRSFHGEDGPIDDGERRFYRYGNPDNDYHRGGVVGVNSPHRISSSYRNNNY